MPGRRRRMWWTGSRCPHTFSTQRMIRLFGFCRKRGGKSRLIQISLSLNLKMAAIVPMWESAMAMTGTSPRERWWSSLRPPADVKQAGALLCWRVEGGWRDYHPGPLCGHPACKDHVESAAMGHVVRASCESYWRIRFQRLGLAAILIISSLFTFNSTSAAESVSSLKYNNYVNDFAHVLSD